MKMVNAEEEAYGEHSHVPPRMVLTFNYDANQKMFLCVVIWFDGVVIARELFCLMRGRVPCANVAIILSYRKQFPSSYSRR